MTPDQNDAIRALANPALSIDSEAVESVAARLGLHGHVLFRTSGSSGPPKWVALSNAALLTSARAVNEHLGASRSDVWLRALPEFHVGGYGIGIRAKLAGGSVEELSGEPWRAHAFADACAQCGATLSALVPTQIYDLVAGRCEAPPELRAVLVGGGALVGELKAEALSLGWPLFETYGMTEAASQVATESHDRDGLQLLDHWEARTGADGELELRGPALLTAYLLEADGGWRTECPFDAHGWFATGDRIALDGRKLVFGGRLDSEVKVLGERVDLDALQARLEALAGRDFAVLAMPDARAGKRLLLVGATDSSDKVRAAFNRDVAGFERLTEWVRVAEIPRSTLGKVLRSELADQIAENTSEA